MLIRDCAIGEDAENALHLVHILTKEDGTVVICELRTLILPTLVNGYLTARCRCRGYPNPMGDSPDCIAEYLYGDRTGKKDMKRLSPLAGNGIRSDPANSVILFYLQCMRDTGSLQDIGMVVHRSHLAKLALESLRMHTITPDRLQVGFDNLKTGKRSYRAAHPVSVAFPGDGTGVNERKLVLSLNSDANGNLFHRIPRTEWCEWGPEATRFLRSDEELGDNQYPAWMTTTAGQRQTTMEKCRSCVKDFNPHSIYLQKVQSETTAPTEDVDDTLQCPVRIRVVEDSEPLPRQFKKGPYAYSSLPYVEYAVKAPPNRAYYSAVLIDDDCLIGVSVS